MILLQYNIEKKVNEEEEDDDSDFEGSKNVEDDLDGMARKFWNLCERLKHLFTLLYIRYSDYPCFPEHYTYILYPEKDF